MTADSTPAPWGPPEGLGLVRMGTRYVLFVPYNMPISRHRATPEWMREIKLSNRQDLVPPTPGGES